MDMYHDDMEDELYKTSVACQVLMKHLIVLSKELRKGTFDAEDAKKYHQSMRLDYAGSYLLQASEVLADRNFGDEGSIDFDLD